MMMQRFGIILLLASIFSSCGHSRDVKNYPLPENITTRKTRAIEKSILKYTNKQRKEYNRDPLSWDAALAAIARDHSRNMVRKGFFDHVDPSGNGPTLRAEEAGYDVQDGYCYGIGENINKMPTGRVRGFGYVENHPDSIAKATVINLMQSSGHREQMLKGSYEGIGIGVAFDGKYYFATQNFK